jgi:hypothetical protein
MAQVDGEGKAMKKRFRVKNVSDFSPCRRARVARSENSVSFHHFCCVTKKAVENFEMSG